VGTPKKREAQVLLLFSAFVSKPVLQKYGRKKPMTKEALK